MMFKNSVKLLCSNFDKVWKLLVFHILTIGLCFGLLCVFKNQYASALNLAWSEANLGSYLQTGTLYGDSFFGALTSIANFVVIFFGKIFANVWQGLYFCLIVFYVLPFFINIGKYVISEMMYGYMSAGQKQSFTGCLLKTLPSSMAYASLKTLLSIPFDALVVAGIWGVTRIEGSFMVYLMPFLLVIVASIFMGIRELFVGGWAPAKITYAHNIARSYGIGLRASLRRSDTIYSSAFVIYLLTFVLTLVFGAYSLIILLPVVFPLLDIFEMVAFFSSQGMRFYVDNETIVSPKKLEEVDKIEDAKYIL